MDNSQKLAFIATMTDRALHHAASTPNIPTQNGGMSHEKMLSFVSAQTKQGLLHLDAGGQIQGSGVIGGMQIPGATVLGGAQADANNYNTHTGGDAEGFLGAGNEFRAQKAPIQAGTNAAQLNNSYSTAQSALNNQAGILNNITSTGGVTQGAQNQSFLANAYLNQVNGRGPNPAQAQFAQNTGQNVANQAALAAGTRGASSNAGLIARQAAQAGAGIQQNSAGQAATLQAQQQLAAEGNLQNLSANQIAQGTSASQSYNNAVQNEQNILQGANTSLNNANVGMQSNINNVNAGVAAGNQNMSGNIISGIGGAIGSLGMAAALAYKGGTIAKPEKMADGGVTGMSTAAPVSYVGQWLNSSVDTQAPAPVQSASINTNPANPLGFLGNLSMPQKAEKEGEPSLLDKQDVNNISNQAANAPMQQANNAFGETLAYDGGLMKKGGKVKAGPGEKAVKPGDSLSNDKVPALLSEGELVIDRDTMKDPGPMGQMARALAQHLSKRNKKK